jgi:hypothetical protein
MDFVKDRLFFAEISGMDCSAEADFGVFKKTAQFLRRFRQAMGSTRRRPSDDVVTLKNREIL